MAHETIVLLRTLLFQAKKAEDLDEIIAAIEVMCSKEDIAIVEEMLAKVKAKKQQPSE